MLIARFERKSVTTIDVISKKAFLVLQNADVSSIDQAFVLRRSF